MSYRKLKSVFLVSLLSLASGSMFTDQATYHSINSELLKKVNTEEPTLQDTLLTTACHLGSEFGQEVNSIPTELLQAITTTQIISELLPKVIKAHTVFGKTASAYQLTQFSVDITTLAKRQALLQALAQNTELTNELNKTLAQASDSEQAFLKMAKTWQEEHMKFEDFYFKKALPSKCNESKLANNTIERSKQFYLLSYPIHVPLLFATCQKAMSNPGWVKDTFQSVKNSSISQNLSTFVSYSQDTLKPIYSNVAKLPQHLYNNTLYHTIKDGLTEGLQQAALDNPDFTLPNEDTIRKISIGMTAYYYAIGGICTYKFILKPAYQSLKSNKKTFDGVHEQQKVLLNSSSLIRSMKETCKLIHNNSEIASLLPEYAKLAELFDKNSDNISSDLKYLIKELLSSTFKGDDSYWISNQGKIIATYHLLMRVHTELVPYLQAFGGIDTLVATINFYNEYKTHNNAQVCIAQFVDQETPMINASNFWHPMIDADKVVTNNLAMGTVAANANLIITGPNAGGKTTTLTALMTNIIFAQAFGIATASELMITPFAKIHSYLDITTNLIEGESLFKAEVNRSKQLKESIASCTTGQKAFTIIDEIFSGTNQEVASQIATQFAQGLGNQKHAMTIITTHIPEMTNLEDKTSCFQNFKVADATVHEDGSITYPFKLVQGKSSQNIAEHMLKAEGIL